jgi:hypothetical protein
MSMRVEWLDTGHPMFSVILQREGEPWDGDPDSSAEAIPSEFGLVLADDDAVVLCGTAPVLRDVLERGLRLLDDVAPNDKE